MAKKEQQPDKTLSTQKTSKATPVKARRKGSQPKRATSMQSAPGDVWSQLFSVGGVRGFKSPSPGTYEQYRKIAKYPTVALAMRRLTSSILSTPWSWVQNDGAQTSWLDEAKAVFDPLQHDLKTKALVLAPRYGWCPFEIVWDTAGGTHGIDSFVPLLVDITDFIADDKGNVQQLRNKANGNVVDLDPDNFWVFKLGEEGESPYGESLFENIREFHGYATQTISKLARYLDMKSQTIGQIHYPEGTSKNASGADISNFVLAMQMANDLSQGKTLLFPNHFASMLSDPNNQPTAAILEKALAAAGKSSWVVSYIEPGGTDYAPGFIQSLQTFDVAIVRGLGLPERSVLEAQHGGLGNGDSNTGDDVATLTESLLYTSFCEQFNQGPLNKWLEMMYGPDAVDSLQIEAPPLDDEAAATAKDFIKTMLGNQSVGTEIAAMIEVPELLDDISIPVDDEKRKTWGDNLTQPIQQGMPGAPVLPGIPATSAALNKNMKALGTKPVAVTLKKLAVVKTK